MYTKNARPKWWQVYLTFPLLIALFVLDSRLKLTVHEHEGVQIGIVLLIYGLIHIWIKANSRALTGSYNWKSYRGVTVIQIPPDGFSRHAESFHFPHSEVHGVLDDTFELEVIDAEVLPGNEVQAKTK